MFTQGLDSNALNWVKQKEELFTSSIQVPRINPIIKAQNRSNGYRLPHSSKFGSGHFPATSISITRTTTGGSCDSGSDNDRDTESEDVYGGGYSLDSSTREEGLPNDKACGHGNALQRHKRYASDMSSLKETVAMTERFARENERQRGRRNCYQEDEMSESTASSEFSSTQVGDSHRVESKAGANMYFLSTPSKSRAESILEKDEEVPSAPPFHFSAEQVDNGTRRTPRHKETYIETSQYFTSTDAASILQKTSGFNTYPDDGKKSQQTFVRSTVASDGAPSSSQSPRVPEFHASSLGPWHAVITYDACVRLCLSAWARGCKEPPLFLENECAILRDAFGLQQVLLQSEEELLAKRSTNLTNEGDVTKPRKTLGKMKVQVRRVKSMMDPPTGCNIMSVKSSLASRTPSISVESVRNQLSTFSSTLSSKWHALQNRCFRPRVHANSSFSHQSMAYIHGSTQYFKKVPGRLKTCITNVCHNSSSIDATHETYSCSIRMKSSTEEDAISMQPGSGEEHIFLPETAGDNLIIEVQDSKGMHFGRAVMQVATVAEDPTDKVRWCSLYREPEHELIGKIQVHINYSTRFDDSNQQKYGIVAETVAYDLVLEVAMKVQKFQQRILLLHGSWKWLLTEFASYYGISDVYTRLRYLSYIMDVATPTADCLVLVHDMLVPVLLKADKKGTLSHQENRILGETRDQVKEVLALAFENYKSLDESSLSGIMDVFRPPTGVAAPALEPAIRLYTLLNDILSPEVQTDLCHHFQVAAKKRSRRHLAETDEYVLSTIEGLLLEPDIIATAYQKMTVLCMNLKDEIFTDMEIHNLHILPSFVDLPSLSSAKYSIELCNRLRSFLMSCPPSGPSPHVAELIIAATDFQRDLTSWKISPVKGGVDAKELFHLYILTWIQDKRNSLVEICKLDKVKWAGVRTQQSTTPFVDDMYVRMQETLNDYEVVICRWPEYVFVLENAIADVESAVMEALEKQYMDVLLPLKDSLVPKKFGLKYVQKLTKRSVCPYAVPDELGILLNSMKRMLDILRPKIESKFKAWGSCMPNSGNTAPGERLSEVTVMLRTKFRNYLQAVAEKLAENTKLQVSTKLKKILQDSIGIDVESDIQGRMQSLIEQLTSTTAHLHSIFETRVFVLVCRHFWDRMGQDILNFLDNHKENRSWNKGSRTAVSILDDTFASQLQHLLGNMLQEKDLEPPRYIMEVRSILCKDGTDHKDSAFYY